ncbi:MAG: sulfate reduction electron transfer complex DsrMKJOP subunit DsrM [Desulfovibrio sp.]|jgi:nitrate reductase gamma subunit|nr:sulfate reduction electron transfer complex DsrMKJOP subunit DsrM [Desulfovibrio sp.]
MFISLLLVLLIGAIAWAGSTAGFSSLFGVALPCAAVAVFIGGMIWRMVYWARSPVPFCIPTTGGQEQSLDFIRQEKFDCPSTQGGVIVRMFLEICLFRSLFRNTSADVRADMPGNNGPGTIYYSSKWLWCFALLFHYCFLLVFLRHFRFFMEPVPCWVTWLETVDGIMQVGTPRFFMTGGILLAALLFLLGRRVFNQRLRCISLLNDYFPLWLLIGIVCTGICLRYFDKTEIALVKVFIMSVTQFSPDSDAAKNIAPLFFVHLTLVSTLLAYFPFSKLTHMLGVFFSPTRNLANNSRRVRHINPWNPPKQFFTYAEYEDTYRDAMAEAGLPLEKAPDKAAE